MEVALATDYFTTDQLATILQTLNDSHRVLLRRVEYIESTSDYKLDVQWTETLRKLHERVNELSLAVEAQAAYIERLDALFTTLIRARERLPFPAKAMSPRNTEESPLEWKA